ncbi:MAG TPA: hypothetical protein VMG10_12275 [Gemmataceae bacterium]|nr:hypothetical protein [Gemmataceae bacterium]
MIFIIGTGLPFGRFELIALLLFGVKDQLLGRHARLRRKHPRRQAEVALHEPRPQQPSGAEALSLGTAITRKSPAFSRKDQL